MSEKNSVVLYDAFSQRWLTFARPCRVIQARALHEVMPALRAVEKEASSGRWAAGFLAYEAASAFDPALKTHSPADFPLLWFGIFKAPQETTAPVWSGDVARGCCDISWRPSLDQDAYESAFDKIKKYIAAGHTYQVNFSYRLRAPFQGDAWQLFAQMAQAQGGGSPAFVDLGDWAICSASPELFFSLENETLISKPMKGTAGRGLLLPDDEDHAARLRHSKKDQAENVMIVDMVRNDMGRIARPGSVEVPRLFEVEKYRTVWQMTSTAQCQTNANLADIFQALFPAASITGAPKVRATQIIRELENSPRHIYTGTIGYLAPRRRAQFNVAIRTVMIDRRTSQAEYGVGGGIVWDSESGSEWQECQAKARVLAQPAAEFSLIETIGWFPGRGYRLLEEHLARLRNSASYFSRAIDINLLRDQLSRLEMGFPSRPQRVRIMAPTDRLPFLEHQDLTPLPAPYCVALSPTNVVTSDVFLYHKTTFRKTYEDARSLVPGCHDVILCNERGELTESCIANVALQIDGRPLTPPLSAGLLPGLERARLLAVGHLREFPLRREDLARAEKVFLLNSVRGLWEARLLA